MIRIKFNYSEFMTDSEYAHSYINQFIAWFGRNPIVYMNLSKLPDSLLKNIGTVYGYTVKHDENLDYGIVELK